MCTDLKSYQNAVIVYDFTIEFVKRYVDGSYISDKPHRSDRSDTSGRSYASDGSHGSYTTYKSYKSYSRMADQMIQAARSGKQNIAEATSSSKQKPKSEPMLFGVASASLKELLEDYQDYLRQHQLRQWEKDDPAALRVRGLYKSDMADRSYRSDTSDTFYKSYKTDKTDKTYAPDKSYPTHQPYQIYPSHQSHQTYPTYKSYQPYLSNAEDACNAMICLINQTTYLLDNQIRAVERHEREAGIVFASRNARAYVALSAAAKREQEINGMIAEFFKDKADTSDKPDTIDKTDGSDKTDKSNNADNAHESNTTNQRIGHLPISKKFLILVFTLAAVSIPASSFAATTVKKATTNGLAGYWSMNEGKGTKAYDYSGNGNTGTLTNGPTWVNNGKSGKALSLDGVSNYINIPASSSLNVNSATFAMWVKPIALNSNFSNLFEYNNGTNIGTTFYLTGSAPGAPQNPFALYANFIDTTGTTHAYTSPANLIANGTWYYVVYTRSGATVKAYLNGVEQTLSFIGGTAISAGDTLQTSYNLQIGERLSGGGSLRMNGIVDEVRIYNRALSQSEITALYQSGLVTVKTATNNGLVGYWSMNEGQGTKAYDYSGNGNTGTLFLATSTPAWVNGKSGKALNFNGVNQYVDSGNIAAADNLSNMTVSVWINATSSQSTPCGAMIIGKITNCITGNGWLLSMQASRLTFATQSNNGSAYHQVLTNSFWNDGKWHHVVATLSGGVNGTIAIYVDGVSQSLLQANLNTVSSISNSASVRIGTDGNATTGNYNMFFNGSIDEPRIYNRALSQSEITALYQSGLVTVKTATNKGLVGYWSFNEGTGSIATDSSGNGNTGTWNGTSTNHWVSGKLGRAGTFNGTSDFVSVATTTTYQSQDFSISFWINPGTQPQSIVSLLDYDHADPPNSNWVIQSEDATTNGNYYMGYWNGSAFEPAGQFGAGKGVPLTKNVWQHIVYTKSGTTVIGYKNGVVNWSPAAAGSATVGYTAHPLRIGDVVSNGNQPRYFGGIIDEVRIYNRALSAAEVSTLYNNGRGQ